MAGARRWALVVLVLGPSVGVLEAQTHTQWVIPTTLGYGGLGCGASYLVFQEALRDEGLGLDRENDPLATALNLGGCLLGARLGYALGSEVDRLLSDGVPVETGKRRGVQLGTVMAGATVGTLAVLATARGRRDGSVVTAGALVGGGLGALIQVAMNSYLHPQTTRHLTPPALELGPGVNGTLHVGVVWSIR